MKISQKQLNSAMSSFRRGIDGIGFNDAWNKANFGLTRAEFSAIMRAVNDEYGMAVPYKHSLARINARLANI